MLIQSNFRLPAIAPAYTGSPELPALLARVQPSAVTLYSDGSVIYAQGDEAGPLYLVEFGAVRVCRLTVDGRRQINTFHFAGEVFGFESGPAHQCFAESIDSSGIRALRPKHREQLADSLLPLALQSLHRAQNHLLILGRQNAVERMAAFLLDLADRQENDRLINLPMQRSDIADYLGMTFETVSRTLRKLKDAKLIRLRAIKQIEILDFESLQAMCE